MQDNGHSYPVIPYDLILDTDIGLYRLINERYKKGDVFATGILEAPLPVQKYFLLNRAYFNPLKSIAYDPDDTETLNDYYEEFFEKELTYILSHSVTTDLYTMLQNAVDEKNVHIKIWCPNDEIANHLMKADAEVFRKAIPVVAKNLGKIIDDINEPVYLKDIRDAIIYNKQVDGKSIFLASYRFNYDDDEKQELRKDVLDIIYPGVNILTYDPYKKEELMVIK